MSLKREEIIDLAVRDLGDFFPEAKRAKLERAHVVKEARATYSVIPGLEAHRPGPATKYSNVFLAGDWTATGWPATMEGAVRSGYLAAEALARSCQRPGRFLVEQA
jgi:zeta-carotene desaturase